MFSDKKLVNSVKERGMSGYDVKLSGQAPYLAAVFKGFVGNRKIGEFLLVAQW
jgi:hypothetical protein